MRHRAFLLLAALLFSTACTSGEAPVPAAKPVDIFFDRSMVDAILEVAEARRGEFLKQYQEKMITGKGEIIAVHETDEKFRAFGSHEVSVIARGVYRDVDVEYRAYVNEETSKAFTHTRGCLLVTGTVKGVEWIKNASERALRVHLQTESTRPCS
jgi:hypothetical protein